MSTNYFTPKELLTHTKEARRLQLYLPTLDACYKEMKAMANLSRDEARLDKMVVDLIPEVRQQVIDHFKEQRFLVNYDMSVGKLIVGWGQADKQTPSSE